MQDKTTCIWSIIIFNISFSIPLPIVFERSVCWRFYVVFILILIVFPHVNKWKSFICLVFVLFLCLFGIWWVFFSFVFCFCIFDYLLLNWFLSKKERVGCGVCKFKFNLDKPEYKNEIKKIALNFFIIIMKISYLILKLHRVFFPINWLP